MKSLYFSIQSLFIVLCLTLVSCKREASVQKGGETRVVTDMAGRQISLPNTITTAFIDAYSVQMIYAFDTKIPVNRVFNYNDTEKKYLAKSFYEGKPLCKDDNVEEIVKMKPQVMLLSRPLTKENIAKIDKLQRETHIPIVLMDVDFMKYKETVTLLGKVLHKEAKAKELSDFITKYADPILAKGGKRADSEKKTVYYAEGMNGFSTDPSGSIHSLLIDKVGAKNVAQTDILEGKGMTAVSPEQVYLWNPEVILVWSGNFDNMDSYKCVKTSPQWSKLDAVKRNKVYQVPWRPFGWIDRPPGINRMIGMIWLSNLLYPNDFHFDMKSIIKEYFQKFYHYNMSDAEVEEIANPQPRL